jgi:hypothetical protein
MTCDLSRCEVSTGRGPGLYVAKQTEIEEATRSLPLSVLTS